MIPRAMSQHRVSAMAYSFSHHSYHSCDDTVVEVNRGRRCRLWRPGPALLVFNDSTFRETAGAYTRSHFSST
jgi:hypothetical protein